MARGTPSLMALLGVLAMAGYQNRDKLAEMLGRATGGQGVPGEGGRAGGQTGAQMPRGNDGSVGAMLNDGLRDLLDRFRGAGHGETAESWVRSGPNRPVEPTHLESAIGPETLDELAQHTGLSREEVLSRLTRTLPDAVDRYTPEGRLPG
ncbi:YidB family protein [Falsiroseomonas sp. HW251]|uniref:YidB family protein n=1 Tax=Falsiroseomonas sp. HW251 TaxID=3390998 RepID=UPI003D3116E9